MIHKVKLFKDSFVEESYKKAMKELGKFYNIKWTGKYPRIFIVDDRKTIDSLWGRKTESWIRELFWHYKT